MTNLIVISGRLTADLELMTSQSGNSFVKFTIANELGYGDKKKTSFINCTAFGKTAESLCKYKGKGNLIFVEGNISQDKYKGKDGIEKTFIQVIANKVEWDWDANKTETMPVDKAAPSDNTSYFNYDAEAPF